MTITDIQQKIGEFSVNELLLLELELYRELEKRNALPETEVSPELLSHLKEVNDGIDKGTVKTFSSKEYDKLVKQHRSRLNR